MASFSVQVNGELGGYFQSKRGLRQGCPLSPYLFVICMNVLSKLIDREANLGNIGYHPNCHKANITHLCFADDLLVFSDGHQNSIDKTIEVFESFYAASGLRINLDKSTIFLAGFTTVEETLLLNKFAFSQGSLPVRYLGLPLLTKRMTVHDYTPLLERIRYRISCWTARFLSFAGRLQLIASVIQSLINFWISAFRLPKKCITEIDRLCASFLWSGPDLKSNKSKVAWNDVCKPKSEGGLGLRPISEANIVSCLKLIWRILASKPSLWVDWIKRHLLRRGSFWSIKNTTSLGSWTWKKLLKLRPIASTLTKVKLRNGSSTSFWFDNWSTLGCLFDHAGHRGCIDMGIKLQDTMRHVIQTHTQRRHRSAFLNKVEYEIQKVQTSSLNMEDDIRLWRRGSDQYVEGFSTKETWEITRQRHPKVSWHKSIWFKHSTPKFRFISWLAILNKLMTGEKMQKWNASVNPKCIFCNHPLENREHLYFSCHYTAEIWSTLTKKINGFIYTTNWTHIMGQLQNNSMGIENLFILRYAFQITIHTIWRERNARRHGEDPISSNHLTKGMERQIKNKISAIRALRDMKYERTMEVWFSTR